MISEKKRCENLGKPHPTSPPAPLLKERGDEEPEKVEKQHKKKRIRVLRPKNIIGKERKFIPVEGEIWDSIGKLERGTKIILKGPSFSGKSSVLIMLIKPLLEHMRVDYNNHEENGGDSGTVEKKLGHGGIDASDDNLRFYKAPIESDEYETYGEILRKKGSAGFAILDSIQHACLDKKGYVQFVNEFADRRGKILAFISHGVSNDYIKHVWHDCDVKLEVIGYVCYVESRLIDAQNKPIIIWEDGAKKHWKKRYQDVIKGRYWPGKKK